jgi:hypothetical protein
VSVAASAEIVDADEQVLVGRMSLDVGGDERALGREDQPSGANVVQRTLREAARNTLAREVGVGFGMGEDDAVPGSPIFGHPGKLITDQGLVPALHGVVHDPHLVRERRLIDLRHRRVGGPSGAPAAHSSVHDVTTSIARTISQPMPARGRT